VAFCAPAAPPQSFKLVAYDFKSAYEFASLRSIRRREFLTPRRLQCLFNRERKLRKASGPCCTRGRVFTIMLNIHGRSILSEPSWKKASDNLRFGDKPV
jgi:hypothetical protein